MVEDIQDMLDSLGTRDILEVDIHTQADILDMLDILEDSHNQDKLAARLFLGFCFWSGFAYLCFYFVSLLAAKPSVSWLYALPILLSSARIDNSPHFCILLLQIART